MPKVLIFSLPFLSVNLFSFIWVLVMDALRAGPDATPPNNMKQALIFNASTIAATAAMFIAGFRGQQKRRELDLAKLHEVEEVEDHGPSQDTAPASSIEKSKSRD
jgi:hypothetical protein